MYVVVLTCQDGVCIPNAIAFTLCLLHIQLGDESDICEPFGREVFMAKTVETYMVTNIRPQIYMWVHVCVCAWMFVHIRVCELHVCMCMCMYVCVHVRAGYVHICVCS